MMKESPRSLKQLWLLLFVVALATRLFIFAAFHYKWNVLGSFAKGAVATDFEGDFWEPAQHIAHGDGCIVLYNFRLQPTAYYPPGQVYLYAGLYRLFPGRHLLAAKILQTLFVSLAFVLFGVYIEALFGRRVAWAAFALMNLSPFLGIAHLAYTVNSSALLLSAVFLVRLESFLKRPTYGGSSELGVWFGLMLLFNSSYIALGLAGVPWLLWKAKVSWKHAVLVSVVAATLLLPWAVRNYRVFGKFIPLRSGFKETFYYGNYPRATGGTREIDLKTNTEPMLELREKIVGKNEVEVGDILFVEALKFIREQPLRFVRVRLNAWLYFWTTEAYWIFRPLPWPRVGLFTLTLAFVALSFAGMWLAVRAGIPRTDLLVVGMLLYAAPYALCAAEIYERYRAVMDPLLIGFSAYALCLSWDRMKGFFSKQKTA